MRKDFLLIVSIDTERMRVQAQKAFQNMCYAFEVIFFFFQHFLIILMIQVLTGIVAGYCCQTHLGAVRSAGCHLGTYKQIRTLRLSYACRQNKLYYENYDHSRQTYQSLRRAQSLQTLFGPF